MRMKSLLLSVFLATPFGVAGAQDPDVDIDVTETTRLGPRASLHLGFASIERADNSMEFGGLVDVGAFRADPLRLVVGLNYLSTQTQRTTSIGQPVFGNFRDLSLTGDLHFQPYRLGQVVPYLGAGLGVHFRSNDLTDPNVADLYDGVAFGVQGALGALVDLDQTRRWGVSAEIRRVFAQNLDRTSIRGGVYYRF